MKDRGKERKKERTKERKNKTKEIDTKWERHGPKEKEKAVRSKSHERVWRRVLMTLWPVGR